MNISPHVSHLYWQLYLLAAELWRWSLGLLWFRQTTLLNYHIDFICHQQLQRVQNETNCTESSLSFRQNFSFVQHFIYGQMWAKLVLSFFVITLHSDVALQTMCIGLNKIKREILNRSSTHTYLTLEINVIKVSSRLNFGISRANNAETKDRHRHCPHLIRSYLNTFGLFFCSLLSTIWNKLSWFFFPSVV